jgi:O-antigen/teichoic acid export membrane protein
MTLQRRLGFNLLWNTVNTWGNTVLVVASTVLYARLLGPEQWGIYSTLTWLVATFALLVNLGWNLTINKYVADAAGRVQPVRGARIFQLVLAIQLCGAVVLGLVATFGTQPLAEALGRPEINGALPLVLLGAAALTFFTICNITLIALQRYRPMSLVILGTSSVSLLGGAGWLLNGGGAYGLLGVVAAANLANAVISLALIARELPIGSWPKFDRGLLSTIGAYSLSATPILLLNQVVFERAEVFFLSRTRPAEEVGFYSLAFAMTNLAVNSVPNVVIGPLLAMSAELHSRADAAGLRQLFDSATRLLALIAPPVAVGGALVAHPLISLLYGEQYAPVAIAAIVMLPPAALLIVAKPATSLLWGLNRQSLMLKALVPGAILNLLLDAAVIPTFGLYGAVVANTCSQIVTVSVTCYLALRSLGYAFPWSLLGRTSLAALLTLPFGQLASFWLDGAALPALQLAVVAIVYPVGLVCLRVIEPHQALGLLSMLGLVRRAGAER